jgi:hypothetical protein
MGSETNVAPERRWPRFLANYNASDPYFDAVRDKRMSELTQSQQDDALELWLIQQLGTMQEYYKGHLAFLLNRVANLRAELSAATSHLAMTTVQGEFATWLESTAPEMPLAAAKEWAEASQWTAQKLGISRPGQASEATRDPTHRFHQREDGLLHCELCNGAEASLPTECPRLRMHEDQERAVQSGQLDFVDGRWTGKLGGDASAGASAAPHGEHAVAPMSAISYVLRDAMSLYSGSRETPDYAVETAVWLAANDAAR